MHFLVRDNLLRHIGSLMQSHEYKYSTFSNPDSPKQETGINDSQPNSIKGVINTSKLILIASFFYVTYEILGIVTFLIVDKKLQPDSEAVITWNQNYMNSVCGPDPLDMTFAL